MSTKQRIFIPTYISSVDYQPARVQPRLLFYNGLKPCEPWYVASGSVTLATNQALESFPYFDNYSGQNTTTESLSLLFFNEEAPYGTPPTASLYTQYWEDYVELLYNPRTRLINASAIIPLADYFKMELNDIVEFRGNYYHLRAINDYSLTDGNCKIQLLGPILRESATIEPVTNQCDFTFSSSIAPITTTTTSTSTTSTSTTTLPPGLCSTYRVSNGTGNGSIRYTPCGSSVSQIFFIPANTTYNLCVNNNQISVNSGANVSFTNLGTTCTQTPTTCQSVSLFNPTGVNQTFSYIACNDTQCNASLLGVLGAGQTRVICVKPQSLVAGNNIATTVGSCVNSCFIPIPITTTTTSTTSTTSTTTSTTTAPPTTTTTTVVNCNFDFTSSLGQPSSTLDYLVVGGGGAGGQWGGGAGGFLSGSADFRLNTDYNVVVGNGGTSYIYQLNGNVIINILPGTNGQNSSITGTSVNLVATGGGRGGLGTNPSSTFYFTPGNGGSGGGRTGTGIIGQGNNALSTNGGGGALDSGVSNISAGSGKLWVDGNFYAGGGGRAHIFPSSGPVINGTVGGAGGGGNGQRVNPDRAATAGTPNTGGAGGGSQGSNQKSGGSGVVKIRYAGQPRATGGTITQVGGYTYHTFNTSGTFRLTSITPIPATTTTTAPPRQTILLAPCQDTPVTANCACGYWDVGVGRRTLFVDAGVNLNPIPVGTRLYLQASGGVAGAPSGSWLANNTYAYKIGDNAGTVFEVANCP